MESESGLDKAASSKFEQLYTVIEKKMTDRLSVSTGVSPKRNYHKAIRDFLSTDRKEERRVRFSRSQALEEDSKDDEADYVDEEVRKEGNRPPEPKDEKPPIIRMKTQQQHKDNIINEWKESKFPTLSPDSHQEDIEYYSVDKLASYYRAMRAVLLSSKTKKTLPNDDLSHEKTAYPIKLEVLQRNESDGLNEYASISDIRDYLSHQQAQCFLTEAFHITDEEKKNYIDKYKDFDIIQKVRWRILHSRLQKIDSHDFYPPGAFHSNEQFNKWLQVNVNLIHQDLMETDHMLHECNRSNLKQLHNSNKQKSKGFCASLCSCLDDSIEDFDSSHMDGSPIVIELSGDTNPVNYHSEYEKLVIVLLQYENNGLSANGSPLSSQPLSDIGQWILNQFSYHYGIDEIYSTLTCLAYQVKNPNNSSNYFKSVENQINNLNMLMKAKDTCVWTKNESFFLLTICEKIYSWTRYCISKYYDVFNSKVCKVPGSLTACLSLLKYVRNLYESQHKYLRGIKVELDSPQVIDNFTYDDLIVNLWFNSFKSRWDTIFELTEENAPSYVSNIGLSEAEEQIPCRIKSANHLIAVCKLLQDVVINDIYDFHQEFHSFCSKLELNKRSPTDYYEALVSECQIFLRIEATRGDNLPELEQPLDTKIFRAYNSLQEYWTFTKAQSVKLVPLKLSEWFQPFVNRWLVKQQLTFSQDYIERSIKGEKWKQLGEDINYSESVVSLVSLLLQMLDTYLQMPYQLTNTEKLAQVFSNIFSAFSDRLNQINIEHLKDFSARYFVPTKKTSGSFSLSSLPSFQFGKDKNVSEAIPDLLGLHWGIIPFEDHLTIGIPPEIFVRVSCIRELRVRVTIMWIQLMSLHQLSHYRGAMALPPRRLEQLSRLQRIRTKSRIGFSTARMPIDEELSRDIATLFGCQTYIDSVSKLNEFMESIANQMTIFVGKNISYYIIGNGKRKDKYEKGGDDMAVQDILDYLYKLLRYISMLIPGDLLTLLATDVWVETCNSIEKIIIPQKAPSANLNPVQIGSSLALLEECEALFRDSFALDIVELEEAHAQGRIKEIVSTLLSPTNDLITLYSRRPPDDQLDKPYPEESRIKTSPYLSRQHIFSVLCYREKYQKDKIAEKFLSSQKKHFFDSFVKFFQ